MSAAPADRLDEHLLPAGLAPAQWSVFDPGWYLRAHPQALAAGTSPAALRAHYIGAGQAAGLSPVIWFDEAWYRAGNPDVVTGIEAGLWRSGFEHYCLQGHADRAPHWLFDAAFYAAAHADLTAEALREGGWFDRYDHFLATGGSGHPLFDPAMWPTPEGRSPFAQFLAALAGPGAEPVPSCRFDPAWYLAWHAEAREAVGSGRCRGALHHYLTNDTPTAFDPLPDFCEQDYLARAPQAAALVRAGVYRNGYAHFLACGAAAGEAPAAWIDLGFYSGRYTPGLDGLAAFDHLLGIGREHGWPTQPEGAQDASTSGALPLQARGRLDFTLTGKPVLTAIVTIPGERARALPALAALRAVAPGGVELCLLDWNGEAGGLAALTPGARVLPAAGPEALAEARNTALLHTTAPAVLFLDGAAAPGPAGLVAGLQRLAQDSSAGLIAGPLVGANGALLEAGGIVWADGARTAYLRGSPAQMSEAGFVRPIDCASTTQMLARRTLLQAIGGFAEDLPSLGEQEADLCLRAWQAGYRVIYDPAMPAAVPGERALRTACLPGPASPALVARHAAYLQRRPAPGSGEPAARSPGTPRDTVLFVVPALPDAASPLVARLAALAAEGARVTLLPLDGGPSDPALLPGFLPDTVEIVCGPGAAGLEAFRDARGAGFFSRVEELADEAAS